ncbi:hypothetical protein [Paenibacillus sp. UMB4589-SE434]|uniref:hypothetical protein n=1 Tax=Paenibacillus sp. UMB4589-SE434 TaxID=3046314 RepID=UPI0025513DFB|nr:hypothetical protein [Paenibacillus sp. UMB4589-SE434]MDK8183821.1 hypothetical protein [Paenibacillus sp. UMB4589-SE434]
MTTPVRISQNSAVLLEKARRFGLSDEQLLQVIQHNDVALLCEAGNYTEWVTYAREHGEDLESAVTHGYKMTFNTVYGLKNWVRERLGFEAGSDYTESEGRMDGLQVSAEDAAMLESTLATNWVVVDQSGDAEIHDVTLVMRAFYQPESRF